uniref:Uncharacterized protein n=3 Tax=Oryza TaxID=4527 RepID=A0A0D3EYT8_9ORYZ
MVHIGLSWGMPVQFLDGTRTREKRRSIITTGMKSKNGGGGGSGGNTNGSHRRITAAAAINIIRTLLSILASPAAVDWTASSGRRLTGCSTLRPSYYIYGQQPVHFESSGKSEMPSTCGSLLWEVEDSGGPRGCGREAMTPTSIG